VNIASSQSWEQQGGGAWRKIVISLSFSDLVRLAVEGRIEGYHAGPIDPDDSDSEIAVLDDADREMPTLLMYRVLQAQSDLLLLAQMFTEGAFGDPTLPESRQIAQKQIGEVRARCPQLK
jgi:hypothetical protein